MVATLMSMGKITIIIKKNVLSYIEKSRIKKVMIDPSARSPNGDEQNWVHLGGESSHHIGDLLGMVEGIK